MRCDDSSNLILSMPVNQNAGGLQNLLVYAVTSVAWTVNMQGVAAPCIFLFN